MQRQEPERKRTRNFAASLAVLYLLHGVEERENDISIPSDKHHLCEQMCRADGFRWVERMGSLGLGRLT